MLRSARSCVCVWGVLSVPLCIEHCPHGEMFQSKARQPQPSLKVRLYLSSAKFRSRNGDIYKD